jgi:hypothetical protein
MRRRLKRLVVGMGSRLGFSRLLILLLAALLIELPISQECSPAPGTSHHFYLFSHLQFDSLGEMRISPAIWTYVFRDGRWFSTRDPAGSSELVMVFPDWSGPTIGILAPWVKLSRSIPQIDATEQFEFDEHNMTPDEWREFYTDLAIDRFGDPTLAKHLPQGGPWQPTLLPLGIIHDVIMLPLLVLGLATVRYRRLIQRICALQEWRSRPPLCPTCRYDRTGLTDRPCPECGWGQS